MAGPVRAGAVSSVDFQREQQSRQGSLPLMLTAIQLQSELNIGLGPRLAHLCEPILFACAASSNNSPLSNVSS